MTKNLPNYYIILRVQPNASREAIKASFRKLMVTMKMHPDLGGDHDIAAQINEAYAVLSDEVKRAKYDRMYLLQRLRATQTAARQKDHRAASNSGARPSARSAWRPNPSSNSANGETGLCPFCKAALPQSVRPETRCARCRSPLFAPPQPGLFGRELFGRRATPRTQNSHFATVHPAGQAQRITVKMRDLSVNGISFYSEIAIDVEQAFRFRDATLEAVALVVSCRKRGQWYSVHAKLLTVAFHHKAGVFHSGTH